MSNEGTAYVGRQGVGKAFQFQPYGASALQNLINVDRQMRSMPKKTPKKTDLASLKIKDPWIRHAKELDDEFGQIQDMATEIIMAGVEDPFAASDTASLQLQQKLRNYEQMANYSQQIKEKYEKDREHYNRNPDRYTTQSADENLAFYTDTPLSEMYQQSLLPPRLLPQNAKFELAKYYGNLASNLGKNNVDPTDEDFYNVVDVAITDPSAEGFRESLMAEISNMPEQEYLQLKSAADANGVEPYKQLGKMQLQSYFRTEPISIPELITQNMPELETVSSSYENKEGVTRSSFTQGLPKDKAQGKAGFLLDANPKLLPQMIQDGLATDRKSAQDYLSKMMINQSKKVTKTGTARESEWGWGGLGFGSEKEVKEDWDYWEKAFRGQMGNTPQERKFYQEMAANFIEGTKTSEGTTITKGRTHQDWDLIDVLAFPFGLADPELDLNKIQLYELDESKRKTYYDADGNRISEKIKDISPKMYELTDQDSGAYVDLTKSGRWYKGGLQGRTKLFREFVTEAEKIKNNRRRFDRGGTDYNQSNQTINQEPAAPTPTPQGGLFDDI